MLGGRAFNVDSEGDGVEVKCFLITDDTAKQLLNNAYHDMSVLILQRKKEIIMIE